MPLPEAQSGPPPANSSTRAASKKVPCRKRNTIRNQRLRRFAILPKGLVSALWATDTGKFDTCSARKLPDFTQALTVMMMAASSGTIMRCAGGWNEPGKCMSKKWRASHTLSDRKPSCFSRCKTLIGSHSGAKVPHPSRDATEL